MKKNYITPKIVTHIISRHAFMTGSTKDIGVNLNENTDDSDAAKQGGISFSWPDKQQHSGMNSKGKHFLE